MVLSKLTSEVTSSWKPPLIFLPHKSPPQLGSAPLSGTCGPITRECSGGGCTPYGALYPQHLPWDLGPRGREPPPLPLQGFLKGAPPPPESGMRRAEGCGAGLRDWAPFGLMKGPWADHMPSWAPSRNLSPCRRRGLLPRRQSSRPIS